MPEITIKRVLIFAAVLIGFALIINILSETITLDSDDYISNTTANIQYNDVKDYLSQVDFNAVSSSDLFKTGAVNKYTLKFFKYLQRKYKDMEFNEHIEAVRQYLYTIMDNREADSLLDLYKKYIKYEKLVAGELTKTGDLKTTQDLLQVLKKMKELQYEIFGKENAEIIFGAMMKAQEYPIRRGGIVNDSNLYASEKEKLLQKLNSDMWGDEGEKVEKSRKPYVAYTETLSIYSKDLSEMSDKAKQEKISEIRKSIFPSEVVSRLEGVDNELEAEKERDERYKKEYNDIMSNNDLSSQDKDARVRNLQDKVYGEEAESVRRMENISTESEELKKKYNIN